MIYNQLKKILIGSGIYTTIGLVRYSIVSHIEGNNYIRHYRNGKDKGKLDPYIFMNKISADELITSETDAYNYGTNHKKSSRVLESIFWPLIIHEDLIVTILLNRR